ANDFSAATLYYFMVNWLFFNIAAPTLYAVELFPQWPNNGYFEPVLANYFSSPVSTGLVALFGVMLLASVLPRYRARSDGTGILLALGVYALLRGAFVFIVFPSECLLFSSGATLAHMLMICVPFAASGFPAKRALLAGLAMLLFITNGAFIIGP